MDSEWLPGLGLEGRKLVQWLEMVETQTDQKKAAMIWGRGQSVESTVQEMWGRGAACWRSSLKLLCAENRSKKHQIFEK